jgi:hypothetical protein
MAFFERMRTRIAQTAGTYPFRLSAESIGRLLNPGGNDGKFQDAQVQKAVENLGAYYVDFTNAQLNNVVTGALGYDAHIRANLRTKNGSAVQNADVQQKFVDAIALLVGAFQADAGVVHDFGRALPSRNAVFIATKFADDHFAKNEHDAHHRGAERNIARASYIPGEVAAVLNTEIEANNRAEIYGFVVTALTRRYENFNINNLVNGVIFRSKTKVRVGWEVVRQNGEVTDRTFSNCYLFYAVQEQVKDPGSSATRYLLYHLETLGPGEDAKPNNGKAWVPLSYKEVGTKVGKNLPFAEKDFPATYYCF